MAVLMLLMPVNYRAGSETAHPHAFFQEMIDLVTGTPHTHGDVAGSTHTHEGGHTHDDARVAPRATISPFLAADIPLAAAADAARTSDGALSGQTSASTAAPAVPDLSALLADTPIAGSLLPSPDGAAMAVAVSEGKGTTLSPDLPQLTDLSPAVEKASALLVLTAVLATLGVTSSRRRDLWSAVDSLRAVTLLVEAPPPRLAPC